MVLNSPCSNPLSQWDGKILRFQVWFNAMKRKPTYFNIHNEYTINKSYPAFTDYRSSMQKPVIYWGTHHKTGFIYIHTYMYIHTYIHSYIHTYIHTYTHAPYI